MFNLIKIFVTSIMVLQICRNPQLKKNDSLKSDIYF